MTHLDRIGTMLGGGRTRSIGLGHDSHFAVSLSLQPYHLLVILSSPGPLPFPSISVADWCRDGRGERLPLFIVDVGSCRAIWQLFHLWPLLICRLDGIHL
jgi:hypothetical protein